MHKPPFQRWELKIEAYHERECSQGVVYFFLRLEKSQHAGMLLGIVQYRVETDNVEVIKE